MNTVEQVLAVLVVLALAVGSAWMLSHRSSFSGGWPARRTRRGAELEVVERLALTAQHSLYLVRVADRALLVAVHGTGCTLLESWPRTSTTHTDERQPGAMGAGVGR